MLIMHKLIPTLHILSKLGSLFSLLMLLPTTVSYFYPDETVGVFIKTALSTLLFCVSVWLLTRRHQYELRPRDGFTTVVLLWLGFACVAALPFYFSLPQMSFTDAFFEAISGLTTTGATVLTGLDTLAPALNLWRHMLNWFGGMGIIVLAVAVLPMLGVGGTQLFKAEIPGMEKDQKLAPRISQVAKRLWLMYLGFTVITCLSLRGAGMDWFDAVCHAMSVFALGGFSTHDASIAYFDSPLIEAVIMLATLTGAMNFANHFAALRYHSLRYYWRDEEVRTMLIILTASIITVAAYLNYKDFYPDFGTSLRYTAFNYVSIGLASGFANADFGSWPLLASLWMFFLSNILANTGSMGGGIKLARAIALAKFSLRETALLLHPNAVRTVKVNGRTISERIAMAIMAFIFVYFATVVIFTFSLMISGLDLISALTAVVACITNAGPGLGMVGPAHNYAELNDVQKWLCATVMLLGRLEIFTVFMLFTPSYWKK